MKAPDVSALANAAHALLRQGDAVGAERVLSPVFNQLKSDASVMHLMGLIKKAQNQLGEAERHLRAAISFALGEGAYYNDLGVVLQARGAFEEAIRVYRAAIALLPEANAVRVNLTRCLIASGKLKDAEAEARAYVDASPSADSWSLLHQVHLAQERRRDALAAAEAALRYAPKSRTLRVSYAAALDRAGRVKEALPVYAELVQENLESPELGLAFARALLAEGHAPEAESVLSQAIDVWPQSTALHAAFARARLARGEKAQATELIERELAKHPEDRELRFVCADILHRSGRNDKALAILEAALKQAPDDVALLTAYGVILNEGAHWNEAVAALERALKIAPIAPATQRNYISTLLRAGRPQPALDYVRHLRQNAQDDQMLIALLSAGLRMTNDPAYARFNDYARYVRIYEIPPPRGFFTSASFNASLAEVLRVEHRNNANPLDQTLTHGTQTGRNLLGSDEQNLQAYFKAVSGAVRDYVAALPLGLDDPVGRRKSEHEMMTGAWSVRLTKGGAQPNHVHDHGWISSAYYAGLSPSAGAGGRLKFGEPHRPMPGVEADHFVEPRVGMLVLFPSYMWHGTETFDGAERLSVAFDVVPG